MWPTTSNDPVAPLDHPRFEATVRHATLGSPVPYRIAIFGDQRALADGEFQALVAGIADREATLAEGPPLIAIIDSGDIVDNGKHADQFTMLQSILEPVRNWPYLVAAGNHELDRGITLEARDNFVEFMGDAPGTLFQHDRLWYRKDAPGLRILFLNTNEWIYGPGDALPAHRTRQLAWLSSQMAEDFDGRTIVAMHHPIVISNKKHRGEAARMWSVTWSDQTLAELFARGGVDLVITGHTHTYERFRITSPTGESFQHANLSGRPRNSFLWFGAGARRAQDIRGKELDHHLKVGWRREHLEGWQLEQLDGMFEDEENQWGELTIHPDGKMEMEVFFLVDQGNGGYASRGKFLID
jgi:hypothetical protein